MTRPPQCYRCHQPITDAEYLYGGDGPRHLSCPVRGRGRPRQVPREVHRLTLRVPADLWQRIEAARDGATINDWALAAFEAAVGKEKR